MLSSVLNSGRAIQVNIVIIRTFVRLRQILAANAELSEKFKELGRRVDKNTADIRMVSHMIQQLLDPPLRPPRRRIGFPPPA